MTWKEKFELIKKYLTGKEWNWFTFDLTLPWEILFIELSKKEELIYEKLCNDFIQTK